MAGIAKLFDEFDDANKPKGKAYWLDGPRILTSGMGFVLIDGFGWGCRPVAVAAVSGDKLGKFFSVRWS